MTTFNKDNFKTQVLENDKLVLVEFGADWCGPCRAIAPLLEKLAKKYSGRAVIGKIDIEVNENITQRYSIQSIPTLMFFKGGKKVESMVGLRTEVEIEDAINRHINE